MALFKNKYRIESVRRPGWDYSRPGYYFITICVKNRECLFGKIRDGEMVLSETGEIVQKTLNEIPEHFDNAGLDCFVVMPNHIHGIIIIEETFNNRRDVACNVSTTGTVNIEGNTGGNMVTDDAGMENTGTGITMAGISPKTGSLGVIMRSFKSAATKRINESHGTPGECIWQPRYYDHIIRDRRELKRVREYIKNNPVNWRNDELFD